MYDNMINIRKALIVATGESVKRKIREGIRSDIHPSLRKKFLIENTHLCYFFTKDIKQNIIKDINSFLRNHKQALKITPLHSKGELSHYYMNEKFIIENMINEIYEEIY